MNERTEKYDMISLENYKIMMHYYLDKPDGKDWDIIEKEITAKWKRMKAHNDYIDKRNREKRKLEKQGV